MKGEIAHLQMMRWGNTSNETDSSEQLLNSDDNLDTFMAKGIRQNSKEIEKIQQNKINFGQIEKETQLSQTLDDVITYQKILDCRLKEQGELIRYKEQRRDERSVTRVLADRLRKTPEKQSPQDKVREMIQQAEGAKARIYDIQGKTHEQNHLFHSVVVDEDYAIVGAHIDDNTKHKIIMGEFVDFSRLIPKDRILLKSDRQMELVSRNGQTFF